MKIELILYRFSKVILNKTANELYKIVPAKDGTCSLCTGCYFYDMNRMDRKCICYDLINTGFPINSILGMESVFNLCESLYVAKMISKGTFHEGVKFYVE